MPFVSSVNLKNSRSVKLKNDDVILTSDEVEEEEPSEEEISNFLKSFRMTIHL